MKVKLTLVAHRLYEFTKDLSYMSLLNIKSKKLAILRSYIMMTTQISTELLFLLLRSAKEIT